MPAKNLILYPVAIPKCSHAQESIGFQEQLTTTPLVDHAVLLSTIREYSARITNILNSITDGFIAVDNQLNVLLWNKVFEKAIGIPAVEVTGRNICDVFENIINPWYYPIYLEALKNKQSLTLEHYYERLGIWFETSMYPSADGQFIYFRDITVRKKQQKLLALEKEVLEINAQPSVSLKMIVDYLLEGIENIFPGMRCSVLTLSADGKTLTPLSAPNLHPDFFAAINSCNGRPDIVSSETAKCLKRMMIASDINNDRNWVDFKTLANTFNLAACWSFPIVNAKDEVLAVITAYHKQVKTPSENDINTFERVSNLLKIIIENKRAETAVRLSNERYLLATKATNDALWDRDLLNKQVYWGDGFYNLFGYKHEENTRSNAFWKDCIHPEDRERVIRKLDEFISKERSGIWQDEYRFKNEAGEYLLVFDRGFLIFNQEGEVNRMVGSQQDITEKRELEKKLLKQELDKQKLVAQAVVDAQEKERADIGNELHDNVNQILSTARLYLELAKNNKEERLSLIDRSIHNLSTAVSEIRKISHSLVPASISDLGLIASIEDLVENIHFTKALYVEFNYSGEIEEMITAKRKLMLFRIIQEQVTNVLKHADAENLIIGLDVDEQLISLSISDDGKGFDKESIEGRKGVGLYNMENRTQLFNGKIDMVTAPGQGCKLVIQIPV